MTFAAGFLFRSLMVGIALYLVIAAPTVSLKLVAAVFVGVVNTLLIQYSWRYFTGKRL